MCNETKISGRMLLGDNTGDETAMIPPVRFQYPAFGLQLGLLVYTYIVQHKYIQFRLAQNSTCARTCVSQGSVCNKQSSHLEFLTCPSKANVLDIYNSKLLLKQIKTFSFQICTSAPHSSKS